MVIVNKDGTKHIISGKSIQIIDDKMYVDGEELNIKDVSNKMSVEPYHYEIVIQGDIGKLEVKHCDSITVTGNVRKVHTQCGSINIKGDVDGDVHTNYGSITCGNVDGDIRTNMGNISYRKE